MIGKRIVNILLSLLLPLLFSFAADAHEMWIEPVKYSVAKNEIIYAHEKVGQNFKGNQYSYLKSSYETLNLSTANKTRPVKSRIGDIPAIHEQIDVEGLVVLSAVTTVLTVKYKSWEQFESFIKSKGLDWVLEKHKKRNLPDKGFTEAYQRFPKSLVKVGEGKGKDKVLGMRFEWVVETNPYTTPFKANGMINARLYWEGKPLANAHVSVFNKYSNELIKTNLYTNKAGVVSIPQANGGQFLINAVQMINPSLKVKDETGAAWESLWASVTYEIKK